MNGLVGTVSTWLDSRRFGFIAGDDGRRYFAHKDEVIGRLPLMRGERVGFDDLPDVEGSRALGIVRLPTPTSSEEAQSSLATDARRETQGGPQRHG